MLKLNKSLNVKTISGKRYRPPDFLPCLIVFIVIFIATLIISANTIPDTYQGGDRVVPVGLLCIACSGLPFAMTICSRKPVCTLSADRLYFFNCEVIKRNASSKKSKSREYTSGSMLYSDIKQIDFFRMKYACGSRSRFTIPQNIVINGEDFSVTIFARRSLMKKIDEKRTQYTVAVSEDQSGFSADEKPQGLWGDIVTAFENGEFENIWSSDVSVEYCALDIDGQMIDITLNKNDISICFSLDKDSVFVSYPQSDKNDTLQLSDFLNIDALVSYMKKCTETASFDKRKRSNNT